jgi:hypothetical protein
VFTNTDDEPGGLGHVWEACSRKILQNNTGSWPILVNRGGLAVLHCFPRHGRARKTAPFLGGSFCISLVEAPVRSTSPNLAKSHNTSKSVEAIRGHSITSGERLGGRGS